MSRLADLCLHLIKQLHFYEDLEWPVQLKNVLNDSHEMTVDLAASFPYIKDSEINFTFEQKFLNLNLLIETAEAQQRTCVQVQLNLETLLITIFGHLPKF